MSCEVTFLRNEDRNKDPFLNEKTYMTYLDIELIFVIDENLTVTVSHLLKAEVCLENQ